VDSAAVSAVGSAGEALLTKTATFGPILQRQIRSPIRVRAPFLHLCLTEGAY